MKEDIVSFPDENKGKKVFHLEMAGISYCDKTYKITRKNSPVFVFEYVIKGRGILEIAGREFAPEAGDVYIVPGYTNHEYRSSADDPWEKIWFNTKGELVERLIDMYGLKNIFHIRKLDIGDLFRKGLEYARQEPENAHEAVALIIHEIIIKIAKRIKCEKEFARNPDALKLKHYLDKHVKKNPSMKEISRQINKSASQAIRIFKKEWGSTPYQYLLDKKISTARLLLNGTAMSVKQVAYELGFNDEYYFSNIFKKKTALAPAHYRNANR